MSGVTVTASIDIPLVPAIAFERLEEELTRRLAIGSNGAGMRLTAGPDGSLVEPSEGEEVEVAIVREWRPGELIALSWRSADWGRHARAEVEVRFEPTGDGTRITFEHRGWGKPILAMGAEDCGSAELVGWFVDELLGPLMQATAPSGLGAWLTDRRARRPAGPLARESYRDPKEHRPGFLKTLSILQLRPEDLLLEIGCGGGAFMRQALTSGCRAVAVDHSSEMVGLTAETNAVAVAEGSLEVCRAEAEKLPFADNTFSCVAMTHVFFFIEDPWAALRECRRVLAEGGRAAIYTAGPSLRGTPGAPQPIARWMNLYSAEELAGIAGEAGFGDAVVTGHGGAHLLLARA
ncbi:MAG TPA: methyltransferase domain-containing protein [Solirubrobacteraceae bacterium]|jgi:SAM-dependent methyltransferase|nr:methyltransferase domain-containing protein [Solirubrobacteraceae bacterium]